MRVPDRFRLSFAEMVTRSAVCSVLVVLKPMLLALKSTVAVMSAKARFSVPAGST